MTDPHDWTHPAPPAPYDSLELTRDIIRDTRGVYALRVKGYSMIDALINDNDIVILRQTKTAENGDMVAVWVKSLELTTLKRVFYLRDKWQNLTGMVELKPENRDCATMTHPLEDIEIQGVVKAVIRHV